MDIAYKIVSGLALFIGVIVILIILVTGKGDAMSGGSSGVRTSFKGKASFEDQMSRWTLILGFTFLALMIILGVIAERLFTV